MGLFFWIKGARIPSIQSRFSRRFDQTICLYVLRCSLFGLVIGIWRKVCFQLQLQLSTYRSWFCNQDLSQNIINLIQTMWYAVREVINSLSKLISTVLTTSILRHHVHSGSSSSKLWVTMKSRRGIIVHNRNYFIILYDRKQIWLMIGFDGSVSSSGIQEAALSYETTFINTHMMKIKEFSFGFVCVCITRFPFCGFCFCL